MFFSNNHGIPWFLSPAKSKKRIAQTLSGWSWLRKGFFTFDTVGNSFSLAFTMLIYADVSDTWQIAVILYWYYDIDIMILYMILWTVSALGLHSFPHQNSWIFRAWCLPGSSWCTRRNQRREVRTWCDGTSLGPLVGSRWRAGHFSGPIDRFPWIKNHEKS
jgi:hypothetical protein